jgi:putative FmdB family regulatory protein
MPTYEYKCKKCGNTFEKFQSIVEEPVKICKKCNGEVNRLISKNGNIILKGNGFYSTDHRNDNNKPENKRLYTSTSKNQEKIETPKKITPETKEKDKK